MRRSILRATMYVLQSSDREVFKEIHSEPDENDGAPCRDKKTDPCTPVTNAGPHCEDDSDKWQDRGERERKNWNRYVVISKHAVPPQQVHQQQCAPGGDGDQRFAMR